MEARVYFAGMRIKFFERFFICPNFSDGCLCTPHAYPGHHGVAGQKNPLVRPGSFFNAEFSIPLIHEVNSLFAIGL